MNIAASLIIGTLIMSLAHQGARTVNGICTEGKGGKVTTWIWAACYIALLTILLIRLPSIEFTPRYWAGLSLMLVGTVMRTLALEELGEFYSPHLATSLDHQLVSDGIYRRLRHPLHLGFVLIMAGMTVLSGSSITIVPLAVGLVTLFFRNRAEDAFLEERFGEAFITYKHQTWDVIDIIPEQFLSTKGVQKNV
jgi:protein-S-isoprenylcysteine O-methyltransferase Ste14